MSERPSFDMSKLSSADKILGIGSLVLLIDSFLAWQRVCIGIASFHECGSASAWGGNASFAGVLMGLFAIALLAWTVVGVMGVKLGTIPAQTGTVLVLGTVVFAVLKFLLVIGKAMAYGAWIGLILALVIAYGGYMKMEEAKARPLGGGGDSAG